MTGTTSHGYPYVTDADHPKEYPGTSKALADMVESDTTAAGGVLHVTASVPSSVTATTVPGLVGTPATWGGVTYSGTALIAPVHGRYRITLQLAYATNGNGTVRAVWAWDLTSKIPDVSGQPIGAYGVPTGGTTGLGAMLSASGVWTFDPGESVRMYTRQDSGVALTANGTISMQLLRLI